MHEGSREATGGQHLIERWRHDGPKRLLALDGGGIRGVVSLAFLERIESQLRAKHGREYLLCDHFDLIGGTSTGAIIAAALASGRDVAWITQKYHELAEEVFRPGPSGWLRKWLRQRIAGTLTPKFPSDRLEACLDEHFDFPLGGTELKTGLMIMMRRADTASPWPMHNIPTGKYYATGDPAASEQWVANRDLKVSRLVLASAAAPTYFKPQKMLMGTLPTGQPDIALFVDGGVSPHNNPALQLLRVATLKGYGLGWPLGAEHLELVSIGTGSWKQPAAERRVAAMFAVECLKSLMDDCADEVELMLQWLSQSRTAREIDGEVGNLDGDLLGDAPLLSYRRYDIQLKPDWLRANVAREYSLAELEHLHHMDRPENLPALTELAQAAAERLVVEERSGTPSSCTD